MHKHQPCLASFEAMEPWPLIFRKQAEHEGVMSWLSRKALTGVSLLFNMRSACLAQAEGCPLL